MQIARKLHICVHWHSPAARRACGLPLLPNGAKKPEGKAGGKRKKSTAIDIRETAPAPSPFSVAQNALLGTWFTQPQNGPPVWTNPIQTPFNQAGNTTSNPMGKGKGAGKKSNTNAAKSANSNANAIDRRQPTSSEKIITALKSQFKDLNGDVQLTPELEKALTTCMVGNGAKLTPEQAPGPQPHPDASGDNDEAQAAPEHFEN